MILKHIKDISLFLLIFSFFNDNFTVEIVGSSSLKIIFSLFFVLHMPEIIKMTFKPNPHIVIKSFFVFIVLLTVVMLSTLIFGIEMELMDGVINFISIFVVFIYFSYYRNLEKLLYFLWAAVVVSAIVSLFNDPLSQYTFRTAGGTADPNRFAMHLLIASAATVYLFIKNKNLFFLIPTLMLFSYAVLYAGSKTSMLVIAVIGLYVLVIEFGFVLKKIFSFKGFIALLILIGIASQLDFAKSVAVTGMQERVQQSQTAEYRFASWRAGMGMIRDHFLVGVGQDNYELYTREYAKVYMDDGSLSPHNILVKLLAETGIFVFLSFITFLFFLFKSKYFEIRRSDYFWISLIPMIALMTGLTLNFIYQQHFWFNFALLTNVILMFHNKNEKEMV